MMIRLILPSYKISFLLKKIFCSLDCLLQKNSVQKFDILKNAPPLTAPLYIAESNQEQIANLDGAIFKLYPDTQWFIYPPVPFL